MTKKKTRGTKRARGAKKGSDGFTIKLGPIKRALTKFKSQLEAKQAKAADKVALRALIAGIGALLRALACQDDQMTRRF